MIKEIKTVGIIGEGKMGTNLFYYLVEFGFRLIWICSRDADADNMTKSFNKKLRRFKDAGVINEATFSLRQNNALITNDLQKVRQCDMIIECISENLALKKKLFEEADQIAGSDCIFVSNSSSFKPSELLLSDSRKGKMAGLHFFYPVSLKNITELIVNDSTSDETVSKIIHFLKIIKKEHLFLNERNGFVLNKIFLDFQNEAFLIVTEKKVTITEMDIIVRKHFFPLGVFEFCDSVGNDVMLTSVKNYISDYNERDRYFPFAGMLDQMVQAGKLGMKSHSGFYLYPSENKTDELLLPDNRFPVIENIITRLNNTLVSSIEKFSDSSGISPDILNSAMKEYLGCDRDLISH